MELSLETIFGLVVGAIFVIIIGFVITSLIRSQISDEIDEATLNSFDEIVRILKGIESGEIKGDRTVAINIRAPFVIMGFSPFEDTILEKMDGGWFLNIKYKVWPDDNINNPCDIYKSCLCVCPYVEPKIIKGQASLGKINNLACSANKAKCVEFDLPSIKGHKDFYGGYLIMTPWRWEYLIGSAGIHVVDEPYKVWINGSKEVGVEIIADVE